MAEEQAPVPEEEAPPPAAEAPPPAEEAPPAEAPAAEAPPAEAPPTEAPPAEAPPPAEEAPPPPAEGATEAPAEGAPPPAEGAPPPPAEGAPPAAEGAPPAAEGAPPAAEGASPAAEGAPPAAEGAPPAAAEGAPPAEEGAAPATEGAPPEAESAPPAAEGAPPAAEGAPPAEEGAPPAEEGAPIHDTKPSKSILAMDKRASTMSKVRVQEPGEAPPEEEKEVKPDDQRRKSSSAKRASRQSQSGSVRGSTVSKDGIPRRRSDRPSKSKIAVGSVVSIRRTSGYGEYPGGGKIPKYMNSYKLDSDNPFHVEKVEHIMKEIMIEALEDLTYDKDKCPKQAKWASSAIRAKVKEQEYDRYRICVMVSIGEKVYHDMCWVIRFLWDIERDKFAVFLHENMYVYGVALCFGIYYE